MPMRCERESGALTFYVSGEVDHHGAKGLMARIDDELEEAHPGPVTVDLSGVSFMDSSGIAVLLRVYRRAGELGSGVTVRGAPDQAMKVLRAAGLSRLMRFE